MHKLVLKISPKCKLWFSDGRDEKGKVVANPTIGYGSFDIKYANGSEKEWFQIGISPNKSGIFPVYILGIKDKSYLIKTFGKKLGKASVRQGIALNSRSLKTLISMYLMKQYVMALLPKAE
ncbi:MAG: DUF1801 domain-containing protein [Bacteroidia bacterium]